MSVGKAAFHSGKHPLSDGNPPSWASGWGEDQYGPWVEFTLVNRSNQSVTQRLRWIGPGSFEMGSDEDEEGRDGTGSGFDEGPQHNVTLTRGYWLFDTPVTQALWETVMGSNPSHFKGSDRPVERVSWDDAQEFLNKINTQFYDLDLTLPTEAQWEYACRAGTTGRYYFEESEGALGDYAWYDENSDNKTQPVCMKKENPWGLYDIHGNVWEWCLDVMRDYKDTTETDPTGSLESQKRALRGGSWRSYARDVRSATRYQYARDSRNSLIGFRCARVRE